MAAERSRQAADSLHKEASRESFSIGAYLQTQRRLREVSLDELAQRTRIPIRSLERLESGAFDGDSDGFVRGFVRTVAEGLGLDLEDTLMRMLEEPVPGARHSFRSGLPPQAWLALAAAVVLVLVGIAGARFLLQPGELVPDGPEIVVRRDPVRALAEAHAATAPAREVEVAPDLQVDAGAAAPRPAASLPEVSSRPR